MSPESVNLLQLDVVVGLLGLEEPVDDGGVREGLWPDGILQSLQRINGLLPLEPVSSGLVGEVVANIDHTKHGSCHFLISLRKQTVV